jgi:hypothetical protein
MTENIDSNDKFETLDKYDKATVGECVHQENETLAEGKLIVKEKYRRTIETVGDELAVQSDADDEERNFDSLENESVDDGKASPALTRAVTDEVAKTQTKESYKAAVAKFGMLKIDKAPANDNYRPVVSWPLMDQLTRNTFEPDKERRNKFVVTARYIRELIDLTEADPLGDDKDSDVQRTESGTVHFDHGMTLDRKGRTYDRKNDEPDARRHDGPVRTAKKAVPIGGGLNSSDPFVVRVAIARQELDAIRQHIGSALWPLLVGSISDNASFTDIGLRLGYKGGQAPPAGSAIIRLALTAAIDALETLNWLRDDPVRPTPLPDKSRGHYRNQTPGPVQRVAA